MVTVSHHTKEFIQYCNDHDIVPFGLPSHLIHLLQSLDMVVFQPLKHYHAKALDIMVRDGVVNITKLEFLACIEEVCNQAFKENTIRSVFRKTGIYSWNPEIVFVEVRERVPRHVTPPPGSGPGLSIQSSPFQTPVILHQVSKDE